VAEQVNAGKTKLGPADALALARSAREVLVAQGKRLIRYDMKKAPPSDEELLASILGRSGTLRAPAVRSGKRFVVGFHPDAFAELAPGG
jgi:arsenate reductase-like glutaredoxin family protein